ncbi:hypothetical protein JHK87_055379 [Glycine soja]|nr:hypothetical protein JHK87_055379 [Glycine soja]
MGLYETIEKMIPDRRTRFLVHQQLDRFKTAKGLFGISMAIDTRNEATWTSKVAPKHTSAINAGATAENLVAELLDTRELVGVVRGIIKNVGTLSRPFLKMGCILGLRVSPTYRAVHPFSLYGNVENDHFSNLVSSYFSTRDCKVM